MSFSSATANSSDAPPRHGEGTEGGRHFLAPGTLFAPPTPHAVTTVLGSCVAVCLWDPVRRLGGINHYLLPLWNGEGLPTPRYGNVAIDALVERMRILGCAVPALRAKVFGGAAMWENHDGPLAVGERNGELAERLLAAHRIPIVASSLGGREGRKIVFQTDSGTVLMRRCRRESG